MFCQPNFMTNKIFAYLNASIDRNKKNCCCRNFNLMRLQYSLIVSVYYRVRAPTLQHFQSMQLVWHVAGLGPNNFILLQSG